MSNFQFPRRANRRTENDRTIASPATTQLLPRQDKRADETSTAPPPEDNTPLQLNSFFDRAPIPINARNYLRRTSDCGFTPGGSEPSGTLLCYFASGRRDGVASRRNEHWNAIGNYRVRFDRVPEAVWLGLPFDRGGHVRGGTILMVGIRVDDRVRLPD
jgi:hypothetical protein